MTPTASQDLQPLSSAQGRSTVIVGAGLGGLSAAIHLRIAGYEVEVFEQDMRAGGRANLIEDGGFRFDTGPSLLNYPWVFEELFASAGRNLYDYISLLPVDPSIAFQWRDGKRMQLSSDRQFLVREFSRFEPDAARAIDRFFDDCALKYRLTFEKLVCRNEENPLKWFGRLSPSEMARTAVWRSLWGELSRFFRSRHIREALGSYAMYLGGSPFDLPGIFTILPYGEMAYGLWLPRGGIYALVQAIEALALELGVHIHKGTGVRRIETSGRGVRGLTLDDGRFIPSETVVSNVDLPASRTRLLGEEVWRGDMTPGGVTFYWGVRGRPTGLGHHTIFLPDDYAGAFRQLMHEGRIPDDLPFYVAMPSATDTSLAPPGDSCIFVLIPVPVLSKLGPVDWVQTITSLRERVVARLRHHDIEFDSRDIVVEHCLTPRDWAGRFGLFDGSAFGAAHNLRQMGPFRASNRSQKHHGLYYVGSSTTPGAGMPMVVLSGKMTAERIAAHVR